MTPSMFLIDLNVIGDRAQFLPLISTSWNKEIIIGFYFGCRGNQSDGSVQKIRFCKAGLLNWILVSTIRIIFEHQSRQIFLET